MFNLKRKKEKQDEEYIYRYYGNELADADDKKEFVHKISEFYLINRRLTHKICIPVLKNFDSIYYCAVARMPGLWLASAIRNEKMGELKKIPLPGTNKKKYYKRQVHLVETSSRYLLGKEFEKFLGKNLYSLTHYGRDEKDKKVVRIALPFKDDYLIVCNFDPEKFIKSTMPPLPQSVYKIIEKNQSEILIGCLNILKDLLSNSINELKQKKNNLQQQKDISKREQIKLQRKINSISKFYSKIELNYNKFIENYIEITKKNPELATKFLDDYFKSYKLHDRSVMLELFFKDDKNKLEDKLKEIFENTDNEYKKYVRYLAITTMSGLPLARYIRGEFQRDKDYLMTPWDQLEYSVELIAKQHMRKTVSKFFGRVKYTVSVYERVVIMTLPIVDDFLLSLSLDYDGMPDKYKELINSDQIKKILERLEDPFVHKVFNSINL